MKVSINWIREINRQHQCSADPMPKGIDDLVEKIGAQLGAVEEVIDVGKKYEGIVVAKVVKCEKHPNADKLSLCLIDPGGIGFDKSNPSAKGGIPQGQPRGTSPKANGKAGSTGVDDVDKFKKYRNKKGLVEVVCGAPNVKAGQLVAWIPPGVTVPSTINKEPFVLESREIRGKISNGMIASQKELDLGDNHTGILVIEDANFKNQTSKIKPGMPFAEVYQLDDYIIDIENKMFTHRPDCFGMLGVARELAGIQGHVFKSPRWYDPMVEAPKGNGPETHKIKFKNNAKELVPRFCLISIKDVQIKPSPVWLQTYLSRIGVRPINNIVDLTNFVMYETAQPIHAYDYDKTKGVSSGPEATIVVRKAEKSEKLMLLGEKIITLKGGELVIATNKQAIGLAGVMGGAATEVDDQTKNIILEVATFDMNVTRKTAMAHGLFTDASTRFTKGQSPLQNLAVITKAATEVKNLAGGRIASKLIDETYKSMGEKVVNISADFINERLGLELSSTQIEKILKTVEFRGGAKEGKLTIIVPWWRTDIEISEDIVEEVGRLYGYDHLVLRLPSKDLAPAKLNQQIVFKQKIRDVLAAAGANEILTYSFIHGSLLEKAGQSIRDSYHIKNALRPELQYYRQSLTPSLLEKVHPNIKNGFDRFGLFEIGCAHVRAVLDKEKLPAELSRLAIVLADKKTDRSAGTPYYHAKHYVLYLAGKLGIGNFISVPLTDADLAPAWQKTAKAYEPARSAAVFSGNFFLGLVGEPSADLRNSLKLPVHTAQAELDLPALAAVSSGDVYEPLNRFPNLEQDITLKVPASLSYAKVVDFVTTALDEASQSAGYQGSVGPLDIFQKPSDKAHKNVTLRITMAHPERTLTTQEVNKLLDQVAAKAKIKLKAERV